MGTGMRIVPWVVVGLVLSLPTVAFQTLTFGTVAVGITVVAGVLVAGDWLAHHAARP